MFGNAGVKELRLDSPEASRLADIELQLDTEFRRIELATAPTAHYAALDDELKELNIHIRSHSMREAAERLADNAANDVPVLISGKTGTGKEGFAKLAHRLSGRRDKPFVAVSCSAESPYLLESSLFGHLRGSFTGAIENRKGVFEEADKGTLFLDEIGEFPPDAQSKLLRVLQQGEIQPVGSTRPQKVDVRVVAATNVDVERAMKEGRFRDDLFYRFPVFLKLPPLQERREDLYELIGVFLDRSNKKHHPQRKLSKESLARLLEHPWPGNVRELETVIDQSVACAKDDFIDPEDLKFYDVNIPVDEYLKYLPVPRRGFDLKQVLGTVRAHLYRRALKMCDGNYSQAARLLNVNKESVREFEMNTAERPA
jgi:transcriptional regulator with PAS, ATPase and Fis domain